MVQLLITVIVLAIVSVPLLLTAWALLDAARRPAWAWALAERSQPIWIAAILLGVLMVPLGLAVSGLYLLRIRPAVAAAESGRLEP